MVQNKGDVVPYKTKNIINLKTGDRISLADLPIGIAYPFSQDYLNDTIQVIKSDFYREIGHRITMYPVSIQLLWYIKNFNSSLLKTIFELNKFVFDDNITGHFLITAQVQMISNNTLDHLPIVSSDAPGKTLGECINALETIKFYKFNIETEEIVTGIGHTSPIKYKSPTLIDLYTELNKCLVSTNIDILEVISRLDVKRKIISTQQKMQQYDAYYVGREAIFNMDWQLNGEYEERLMLHPRIHPLLFNIQKGDTL